MSRCRLHTRFLFQNIGTALNDGRRKAIAQVNQTLVETNWNIGKYIVEYEQAGHEQAKYGSETSTLKDLNQLLGKETIDTYNTGESRGREESHSLPPFCILAKR